MHYLNIKRRIEKILPQSVFDFVIKLWRGSYIRIINAFENYKIRDFKNSFFKEIVLEDIRYWLKIDPQNGFVDNQFYLHGIYEKDIYHLMKENIKSGDICVDIGANIGMYTNFLPQLVGEKGKVIAFEPIKRVFEQNKESIKKNNYKNVRIYNDACSDKEESQTLYLRDNNIGGSSIVYKELSSQTETITTIIGDDILLKEENIDFIKIDTEGFELHVLRGIEKTLEKFRPTLIIEFSPLLFSQKKDGLHILELLKKYYKMIKIIEQDNQLNLNNKGDSEKYLKLIDVDQVNLLFYKEN